MRLVRTVPRLGVLPELRTYECRACGIHYTAETPHRRCYRNKPNAKRRLARVLRKTRPPTEAALFDLFS
jgi:transposase-like protein